MLGHSSRSPVMDTDEKGAHLAEQGQSSFTPTSPTSTNIIGDTLTATGDTNGRTTWTLQSLFDFMLHFRRSRRSESQGSADPHQADVVESSKPPDSIVRSCTLQNRVRNSKHRLQALVDEFPVGYPNLAVFADSDESFSLYRRFGYLQSRLLLDKQDELRQLESQLDNMDRFEENPAGLITRSGQGQLRKELLAQIELKFRDYASLLGTAHELMSFNRPADSEHQSVLNYMFNEAPIHDTESQYIYCKEDLVTLRPGRENSWLDRSIEKVLQPLNCSIVRYLFCSKESQRKASDATQVYCCRKRIERCSVAIVTVVILFLLIVPIYLLFHLIGGPREAMNPHANAVCIGILLVFTLLFSAAMSLFTSAKKHEILGAAAA
ncbi:hypothetical protein LTR17_009473 [Elasticomyces elasticus]|nr:hypothetical protein LTR17_009473 [Elasticomyces elasticus]